MARRERVEFEMINDILTSSLAVHRFFLRVFLLLFCEGAEGGEYIWLPEKGYVT